MRILVVSEYHILNTGYSAYYKNICQALHDAGHEVSELASYGNENLKEHTDAAEKCPWDVYLNIPKIGTPKWAEYNEAKKSKFDVEFGSWCFEEVVLKSKPDVVIAIRDHWYDKFILDSPLANYYKTVLSPTVDASVQKNEWLYTFSKVDYLTTYNQWSEDWLRTQYGGPNIVAHIPPGPNPEYKPMDKNIAKSILRVPKDKKVLLTVMRNQFRKKYPELFEALSKTADKSIILYCHTHFQDRGWDLPKLALQYDVADRVYYTYKCKSCPKIKADIFKTNVKCGCGAEMEVCSVQDGLDNNQLNYVYNSADLYVQWHLSEGFGIPTIEAAATGLPVITVNYSAQEDVAKKIKSFPIDPLVLQREISTLCNRAVPDNETLTKLLDDPNTWEYNRDEVVAIANENYSWENTGTKWVSLINSIVPKNNWAKQPVLKTPPQFNDLKDLPVFDFVRACILHVAQDPDLLGSFINVEALEHLESGYFVPEDKVTGQKSNAQRSVTKEMVYYKFYNMLEERVKWEREKSKAFNL